MIKAYILLNVKGGTEDDIFEKLQDLPEVEEISMVWGLFDIIMKVNTNSKDSLDKLVTEVIGKLKNISNKMTMIIQED
ncbi:MAG: Lrp/AsnC family transcriptional regulator [Asgard group archaeon]|nr:Lrp/AsnC family transcriptional regulator [Asgard group archaeon]